MTRDERKAKAEHTTDRLLDQVNAAIDFSKPGDAADYASAWKDLVIGKRELEDED